MHHVRLAIALAALAACGKGKSNGATDDPVAGSNSSDHHPTEAKPGDPNAGPGEPAAPSNGIVVRHDQIPEFTGSYDVVLARRSEQDHETVVAFVKGCPQLTCEVGAWEPEQVAHACPKAFIATAHVPTLDRGKFELDLQFAGPAEQPSTGRLEYVSISITANDDTGGVVGTIKQHTSDSAVKGGFTAPACPRT